MAYSIGKAKRDIKPKLEDTEIGPGSYQPKLIGKKHDPEWGFGTSSRNVGFMSQAQTTGQSPNKGEQPPSIFFDSQTNTMTLPGPGQYQVINDNQYFSNPSVKFGSEKRFSTAQKSGPPGPGTYNFENLNAVKQATANIVFGHSERGNSKDRSQTPGPGAYDRKGIIGREGPSRSIGMKPSVEILEKERLMTPGPGQYNPTVDVEKHSPPKWVIGTASREDFTKRKHSQAEPGPGNYNPLLSFTKTKSSAWLMGTEKQRPHTSSQSPGPGEYDPHIDAKMKAAPNYRIGTAPRYDFTNNRKGQEKPGPGNYTPQHSLTKTGSEHWSFGTGKRKGTLNKLVVNNPGPDRYSIPSKLASGPKYFMGVKFSDQTELKRAKAVPGPGEYEISPGKYGDSTKIREPEYKIGTAPRMGDFLSRDAKRLPGPGNYNTIEAAPAVKHQSPQYRFGTGRRIENFAEKNSPERVGPGTYEAKKFIGQEGPKNSLSMKFKEFGLEHSRNLPGPGEYAVSTPKKQVLKATPSYGIGTSQRPTSSLSKEAAFLPSPGQYNPNPNSTKFKSQTYVFGTQQRIPPPSKDAAAFPGPGTYQLPPKYKQPRFAMGIKFKEPDPSKYETPGPGAYEGDSKTVRQRSPSYTMTGKSSRNGSPTRHTVDTTPGPGQYKVGVEKPVDGPKYGFGTSQRSQGKSPAVDTPGPGQYKIPSKIADLPRFAMPNVKDEFRYI